MDVIYRKLTAEEITPALFQSFRRFQKVERCWRKEDGIWVLKDIAFTEDWGEDDYRQMCPRLRRDAESGAVFGAFWEGALKGFASVEGARIGSGKQYAVLSELHVSEDCRRMGLGRQLFGLAAGRGRELGAKKLYISAMSAEESQRFYLAMGCVEAEEYDPPHVEKEPCDVQMEYIL